VRAAVAGRRFPPPVCYVIATENLERVKIGHSRDPERRVRQLQTGTPERLVLLATMWGGEAMEGLLHKRLAASRVGGEWYEGGSDLYDYLKLAMAKNGGKARHWILK
jgi:hypothetical protein